MDVFQKAKVWNHYLTIVIALRTRPTFFITPMKQGGAYLKVPIPTEICYLNVTSNLCSFEKWIAEDNKYPTERYQAPRGIYDWYWKFKHMIAL